MKKIKIRDLIKDNQIKEANERINDFISEVKSIEDELAINLSKISHLKEEEIKGTSSSEEKRLLSSRSAVATLYSCTNIEKTILKYFSNLSFNNVSLNLLEQLSIKFPNRYDSIEEVVKGSSATFFKAKKVDNERIVMLRVSNHNYRDTSDKEQLKSPNKFFQIKHRNIIKVFDSSLDVNPKLFELEYIDGRSFDHLISKTSFSTSRAISIFRQLADAIYYLHVNGITHKNIKPDKILLDRELVPVISTFDIISSSAENQNIIKTDQLLYLAPEVIENNDKRSEFLSDQFSLGVVMFEIFSGEQLFGEENSNGESKTLGMQTIFENRVAFFKSKKFRKKKLSVLNVPNGIKKIISKMLAENPKERFENIKKIIIDLDKIKISKEQDVEIALDSYERCCISNPDFIKDFYDQLFESSKHNEKIKTFFEKGKKIEDEKRFRMLRVAIDLLINCKAEPEKLKFILNMKIHSGIENYLYESFVETIIKQIEKNDTFWNKDKKIQKAWDTIKDSFSKILEDRNNDQ